MCRRRRKNGIGQDALATGPTAELDEYLDAKAELPFEGRDKLRARVGTGDLKPFVAVLLSPKTLIPVAVSLSGYEVIVHDLSVRARVAQGYYGHEGDEIGGMYLRQHMHPGISGLSYGAGGFGPLAYYGGALCAHLYKYSHGNDCTFSSGDCCGGRSGAAEAAWRNFRRFKLAFAETHEQECPEPEYEDIVYEDNVDISDLVEREASTHWDDLTAQFSPDPDSTKHLEVTATFTIDWDTVLDWVQRHSREYEIRSGDTDSLNVTHHPSRMRSVDNYSGGDIEYEVTARRTGVAEDGSSLDLEFEEYLPGRNDVQVSYVTTVERESDCGVVDLDVMCASAILDRSGLVCWVNPEYENDLTSNGDGDFTPPNPEILSHLNPEITTPGWFAAIFRACAVQSTAPLAFLTQLGGYMIARGLFDKNSPMRRGYLRVYGDFQPDPTPSGPLEVRHRLEQAKKARSNGRRRPRLRTLSTAQWLKQAAALGDIGQE